MSVRVRVVSIGALAAHPMWGERGDVRPGHATTVLVQSGEEAILVDPSLPASLLVPRLAERSGLRPEAVTHVFLTSFHPLRRRGLEAFPGAQWLVPEMERELFGQTLVARFREAHDAGDADLSTALRAEIELLQRARPAPDRLAPGVDLFPLPGVTPGCAGLLVGLPRATVLVAGDAVATQEHLEEGKVLAPCFDLEQARASFAEAVEISDVIICGRDDMVVNPVRRPFEPR